MKFKFGLQLMLKKINKCYCPLFANSPEMILSTLTKMFLKILVKAFLLFVTVKVFLFHVWKCDYSM